MKDSSHIDNQHPYWDAVASTKSFTHPLDHALLTHYIPQKDAHILDFGCGYGRLVQELQALGYTDVAGYDTSAALIARGRATGNRDLHHIATAAELPVADGSVDAILLFAVLTCIPSNAGQRALIDLLLRKLRPGGMLYISDYYLQAARIEAGAYSCLEGDPQNDGVFALAEGVTLRHHPRAWIMALLQDFEIVHEGIVEVVTMNGNRSEAFQIIARK
jgi:SAM-dependent methyltransferase